MPNNFVTFCFDIGRINRNILLQAAIGLTRSLDHFKNNYTLTIYTNINELCESELNLNASVRFMTGELLNFESHYRNLWLDLSYHKIKVIKNHLSKNESPIWLDLDTIVCRNIDHLEKMDNFFIMQGGEDMKPFHIFEHDRCYPVPNKNYIQGNIWKINKELIDALDHLWDTLSEKPAYDLQGLYNLAYHYKGMEKSFNILSRDSDHDTINGLEIVNTEVIEHPTIDRLKDSIYINDTNDIIHRETGKKVQFFTFTFLTLERFIKGGLFSHFSDEKFRKFLEECKYI